MSDSVKLVKVETSPENRLGFLTGEPDKLSQNDKLDTLKSLFVQAKKVSPNYSLLKTELGEYNIELPGTLSVSELSSANKLYAICQAYISRVTAIEISAIDNHNRWERLVNTLESYIEEAECNILLQEEVQNLPNAKSQQAFVRRALSKEYAALEKLRGCMSEAGSFKKQVELKKKDLVGILMNMSRQIKALSLEHFGNH